MSLQPNLCTTQVHCTTDTESDAAFHRRHTDKAEPIAHPALNEDGLPLREESPVAIPAQGQKAETTLVPAQ